MQIYALLRARARPLSAAELLSRAASLAEFFEEFMDSRPTLPVAEDELPRLCAEMPREAVVREEADAVSLLWQILHPRLQSARRVLGDFARIAPPIVYVGETPRRPWTDDFLRQCANGAEVFAAEENAASAAADVVKNGAAAWRPRVGHIARCREGFAASPHAAAHLALAAVRDCAAENKTVGIVVYDRLLARRLRAVAENHGVRIKDDGGWRMETLSFGGALRQWTETVCAFAPAQFGKILSPPFWRDMPERGAAAAEWRRLLGGDGALPFSLRGAARLTNAAFAPFAENLAAARQSRPRNAPPRRWTQWLLAHSAAALAAWKDDPVAAVLRAELAGAAGGESLTTTEFRAWLNMFMRGETGGDGDVSSRACFVPPTTSRRFDSLVLLGARGGTLPPPSDSFWGENGRRALGLPERGEYVARQLAQFARLTEAHSDIAAIWLGADDGREVPPSPFWTLLTDALKAAGKTADAIKPAAVSAGGECKLRPPPPARGRAKTLPRAVGVSSVAALMSCPYHFFARSVLRLSEDDESDSLTAAGRGVLLHRGLKQFIEAAGEETRADKLLAHWRAVFSALPAARPGAKLAIQHWLLRGEEFAESEAARRADGWRPQALEYNLEAALNLSGGEVLLRGRLDRADYNAETGEWAFTDYKSGGGPNKKAMHDGEDPQLPLYAFLFKQPRARWRICYPANDSKTIETEGDSLRVAARLRAAARRIAGGAPMRARLGDACKRCPSRRLCRRDHWRTEDGETAAH